MSLHSRKNLSFSLSPAASDSTASFGPKRLSSFCRCSTLSAPLKAAAQNSPVEMSQNAAAPASPSTQTEQM